MRRRDFVVGAVSFAAVTRVSAQPVTTSRRLAIVNVSDSDALMHELNHDLYRVLFTELRRLGRSKDRTLRPSVMKRREFIARLTTRRFVLPVMGALIEVVAEAA